MNSRISSLLLRALTLLVVVVSFYGPSAHSQTATLTLLTEQNPPLNYQEPGTGKLAGVSTDTVFALMERAGISYTAELLPWNRAYQRAQDEPNACLFSVNVTEERMPLFKWVRPIAEGGWALFARADDPRRFDTLIDLQDKIIGTATGGPLGKYLQSLDLNVIDITQRTAVPMLASGRIDLLAAGLYSGYMIAKETGYPIRLAYTMTQANVGLACNKNVPDAVIDKLNKALVEIRADGTYDKITARYRP